MTWAGPAAAQSTCPDLDDYGSHTPQEVRFRPSDRLPVPTGVNNPLTCTAGSPKSWCADNIASYPHPNGAAQRDHLFVWFPGVNVPPERNDFVPKLAAFAGGTDPQDWDDFCDYDPNTDTTTIDWANTEVGGYSMGAAMASYISYVAPDVPAGESIGFLGLDSGVELCEWPGIAANPSKTADYYPDEYDQPMSYPACGPCIGIGCTAVCDDHNRFIFTHMDATVGLTVDWADTALQQVGIDDTPTDLDALIGTFPIDFEDPNTPGDTRNLLQTTMTLGADCGGHASMGEDICQPKDKTSGDLVADMMPPGDVRDAYLAPAWLSAVCLLDTP